MAKSRNNTGVSPSGALGRRQKAGNLSDTRHSQLSPQAASCRSLTPTRTSPSHLKPSVVDALRAGGEKALHSFVEKARKLRHDGTLAGAHDVAYTYMYVYILFSINSFCRRRVVFIATTCIWSALSSYPHNLSWAWWAGTDFCIGIAQRTIWTLSWTLYWGSLVILSKVFVDCFWNMYISLGYKWVPPCYLMFPSRSMYYYEDPCYPLQCF